MKSTTFCVVLHKSINIYEEHIAYIFRVEEYGTQKTNNKQMESRAGAYFSTLKM
jgi:hypothetical protein